MQKKKSLKRSHKSCFWHFRKTAKKVHNKEYIYIYIYIYTQIIYIYTHTAEPQERLRKALEAGADEMTVPVYP